MTSVFYTEQRLNNALSFDDMQKFVAAENPMPLDYLALTHRRAQPGALTTEPDGPYSTPRDVSHEGFYQSSGGSDKAQPEDKTGIIVMLIVFGVLFVGGGLLIKYK